ncbi:MAG: minor capsid protein [Lachnospiraceae bacterium]
MLALADIRDFLQTLEFEANHYYIGKMDIKPNKAIGVYTREEGNGTYSVPIGGKGNKGYDEKGVSILVHWNNNARQTQEASFLLYEELENLPRDFSIGDTHIYFVRMVTNEPVDVGTDEKGIYEQVIWIDFVYQVER